MLYESVVAERAGRAALGRGPTAMGYVTRRRRPDDERQVSVILTPQGKAIFENAFSGR